MFTNMHTHKETHTPGHGLLHMHTLALIWHSKTHVVTAWGMPGNSFKGMLIFQMLLDINKPPNWRAEIRFERSSAWWYRDVYPSLHISVAGWLSGHLVFTYDKGFLFDYQLICSQQRGHNGERSLEPGWYSAVQTGQTGWENNLCGLFYHSLVQDVCGVCCAGLNNKL